MKTASSGTVAITIAVLGTWLYAQAPQAAKRSPSELLDQFYRIVNNGDLLTTEGWKRAAALFDEESLSPRDPNILVTTKHPLGTGPFEVSGDRGEADEKWVDDLGTITPDLAYKPPPKGSAEVEGTIWVYHLVLTTKHWQYAADGKSGVQVTASPEWRIEGALTVRSASKEAAIRYLRERRAKTNDPKIRANADKTIAILRGLPAPRTHI